MHSVEFEPTGEGVWYRFALDGQPPRGVFSSTDAPILQWSVRVAYSDHINLSTGGKLNDLRGIAIVEAGSPSANGQKSISFKDDDKPWDSRGWLMYRPATEDDDALFEVHVYVSERLFDRIVSLVLSGHAPSLQVWLGNRLLSSEGDRVESDALKSKFYDASYIDWDNKIAPWIEVDWCKFISPRKAD